MLTKENYMENEPKVRRFADMQGRLHATRDILREIRDTGDSKEFGVSLSEFDSLARLGLERGLTPAEQERADLLEEQFVDSFDILADAVLATWAHTENMRNQKLEP